MADLERRRARRRAPSSASSRRPAEAAQAVCDRLVAAGLTQHPQLRPGDARRAPRASTSARSTSASSCRSWPSTSSAARPSRCGHDPARGRRQPPHRPRRRCSTGSRSAPTSVPGLLREIVASPYVAEAMVLVHLQPGRGLRRRRPLPRRRRRRHRPAGQARRGPPRRADPAPVRPLRATAPSSTCSRWRPGSTRWSWASSRSSARSAAPCETAQDEQTAGRGLNDVAQTALRVGKRVHAETGIDRAGSPVVSVGLEAAADELPGGLGGVRAVVVGAGAMSSLAAASLRRAGVAELPSSTAAPVPPHRLADTSAGRPGRSTTSRRAWPRRTSSCRAPGPPRWWSTPATSAAALPMRPRRSGPLVVVDLALPHDTDPRSPSLPGVTRIDLAALAARPRLGGLRRRRRARPRDRHRRGGRASWRGRRPRAVEPIVVSLRARADGLVDAELDRLRLRLPGVVADAASPRSSAPCAGPCRPCCTRRRSG